MTHDNEHENEYTEQERIREWGISHNAETREGKNKVCVLNDVLKELKIEVIE